MHCYNCLLEVGGGGSFQDAVDGNSKLYLQCQDNFVQSRLTRHVRAVCFQDNEVFLVVSLIKAEAGEWLSFINIKKQCR